VHAPDTELRKIAEFELYKKELKKDPAVQEMPVQSMITNPSAGDIISAVKSGAKSVAVKGVAWGGGGHGINRVDVSLDNGKNFLKADVLDRPIKQKRKSQWAWVFFEKEIPIPDDMRKKLENGDRVDMVLTSKALNAAWNVQPESAEPNRNAHGCCVNHWYRVPVTVCPKTPVDIKAPDGDFGNKPSGGRFSTPFRNLDHPAEAEERRSRSMLAEKMGIATSHCTCGLGCREGYGCLAPRFDGSPSRLYQRMKQQQ
jgi:sulfite oxidase